MKRLLEESENSVTILIRGQTSDRSVTVFNGSVQIVPIRKRWQRGIRFFPYMNGFQSW
ncbi:hypothetical protein [Paenibacillus polymyxa]|uniref:hypothetical protein n=1 Tax=Paenibacillus polymyxa TaxID=1406 RepID=UPI0020248B70|nr:hypothetical protein [Paenibacillus polymyxa]URJ59439.1 hypothetical protein MF622_004087 [Paenibacillus polymyxa]